MWSVAKVRSRSVVEATQDDLGWLFLVASLVFSEYKAEYALSYADCFALASAAEYKATLVTGDPEFKRVEHLLDIVWIYGSLIVLILSILVSET